MVFKEVKARVMAKPSPKKIISQKEILYPISFFMNVSSPFVSEIVLFITH